MSNFRNIKIILFLGSTFVKYLFLLNIYSINHDLDTFQSTYKNITFLRVVK